MNNSSHALCVGVILYVATYCVEPTIVRYMYYYVCCNDRPHRLVTLSSVLSQVVPLYEEVVGVGTHRPPWLD